MSSNGAYQSVELTRARSLIRDVPDYPSPGILFRDLTPMIAD
ncbi:MAG: adenine phosphoribosyltransferase, partial [Actinobacteria bacterium]|nr:adenine phosphoribosyltransferase [Actinomycetota bacterium]